MSKRHHSNPLYTIMGDVMTMTEAELEELYGIEISEDGSVYDLAEFKEFKTVTDWARYMDSLEDDDNYSSFTKIGHKQSYDDDY